MRRIITYAWGNLFFRNSIVLFGGTMIVNVLNYVFHLVLGRMATPEEYGEIESLISLLVIVSVPAAALGLIATKYGAITKKNKNGANARSIFVYLSRKVFILAILFFLVALFVTPLVKDFLNLPSVFPIVFLWFVMGLSFLGSVAVGFLNGWQQFGSVNYSGISATLVKIVFCIGFLWIGYGVSGVMGGLVVSGIISYGVSYWFLKKVFLQTESSESIPIDFSSFRYYLIPFFLGTLAVTILGNVDLIFAKHALDPVSAGEYGALSVTAKTIFFATGVLTTVLFSMTAGKDRLAEASQKTFLLAFCATFGVVILSILLFFLFPEIILSILFGNKYVHMSEYLGWFAIIAGLYSVVNLLLQYFLSIEKMKVIPLFLFFSSLEVVILFLFGDSLYAIISITIFTQLIVGVVGVIYFMRKDRYV